MKPVYLPCEFGTVDTSLTSYSLKDGTVTAFIRPDPSMEGKRPSKQPRYFRR